MTIFVGRWGLLPKNWDGINTILACTQEQLAHELNRELDEVEFHGKEGRYIAIYEPIEFEDTFNQTLDNPLSSNDYWIRIFTD